MKDTVRGAREAAFRVLNRVEGGDSYADILLMKETEGLSTADAALATEIAYGVLRWKMRLDFAIDLFASIKTRKLEHRVLSALRVGAYQLLFLTRVPAPAAINESVKLLRKDGPRKTGFVNAVLRRMDADRDKIAFPVAGAAGRLSTLWSHPEWMVSRWVRRYGEEGAEALLRADQEVPPRVVRVNTFVCTRERLLEEFAGKGVEAAASRYCPSAVRVLSGGPLDASDSRYYIQDEASQLVSCLLSPAPGSVVLDACAAPGGKTTHLAALMGNDGMVVALDIHPSRLRSVNETARRLGAAIIRTVAADASADLPLGATGLFDYILCDAPCSGLGVLRRSPDIKYRRKEDDIKRLAAAQARILDNLSRYLKKGGVLVYSTCTFEPEETCELIEAFIKGHEGFALEDAADVLPGGCSGLVDEKGFMRTRPDIHGMDGFFGARLRRIS